MNILTALGLVGYAMSDTLAMAMASGALIGFAMGGEGNVLPYMMAKHFGRRAFGKLYGATMGIFGLGTALGPVIYALLVNYTGSIRMTLLLFSALVFFSAGNFLLVGRRKLY